MGKTRTEILRQLEAVLSDAPDDDQFVGVSDAEVLAALDELARAIRGEDEPVVVRPGVISPGASPELADLTDEQVLDRYDAARAELERRRPPPQPPAPEPTVVVEPVVEPIEPHPVVIDVPPAEPEPVPLTARQLREREVARQMREAIAEEQERLRLEAELDWQRMRESEDEPMLGPAVWHVHRP